MTHTQWKILKNNFWLERICNSELQYPSNKIFQTPIIEIAVLCLLVNGLGRWIVYFESVIKPHKKKTKVKTKGCSYVYAEISEKVTELKFSAANTRVSFHKPNVANVRE